MSVIATMAMRLNKIYTSNGSRLVSKVRDASTEVVKVETNFGKGLTTIMTTLDVTGKPLRRVIEKRNGKNYEKTIFNYKGSIGLIRRTIIDKFVNNERVQKIIKSEVLSKSNFKPVLTRMILQTTPLKNKSRNEIQTIEELSVNKHRKYIKTTAVRNKNGELSNKTIEGNIEELKQLEDSPYLYFRSYSLKEFLSSIIPYAKRKQRVLKRDIEYNFESLKERTAATSSSDAGFGTVTFDMKKLNSYSSIVDTVNHELRHQYQDSIIEKFEQKGLIGLLKRIVMPFKYSFAKRCAESKENYISLTEDYTAYLRQYVELDASLAGYNARAEFVSETSLLDRIFPKSNNLFSGEEDYFKQLFDLFKR